MFNLEPITIKQIESKTVSIIANGTNVSAQISANIVEILPISKIAIFNGFLTSVFLLQKHLYLWLILVLLNLWVNPAEDSGL